jgi:hypothetical protein
MKRLFLLTDYHAKYLAYELTKRAPSNSMESLAGAIASAQVDLNPHQVDAALFAFGSPLSKGGILADEVGLGKTIEAGLIISQRWAERRRRILIIAPSNLRKQWNQELTEKFFLPSVILESKSYKDAIKDGQGNPFLQDDKIVICSYQFARNKASEVEVTPWDLVVIDEAHRLRNVYKPTNVIANALKQALDKRDNWVISKEYNPAMLAEAVCKLEGFTYQPSDTVYWQHGYSTETDFIYVTTQNLSAGQLEQLSEEVGDGRTLLVLCSAFRGKGERFENLTVKKIPKQVLSRCEWGHDDYSLNVENLPKAPPKAEQQSLFQDEEV